MLFETCEQIKPSTAVGKAQDFQRGWALAKKYVIVELESFFSRKASFVCNDPPILGNDE